MSPFARLEPGSVRVADSERAAPADCDKGLQRTFRGECDHKSNFFVKSHFPALPKVIPDNDKRFADFYHQYDQVVHVVRNPLDAISSWWHLANSPRTAEGFQDHENKVALPGGKFGDLQRDDVLDLARRWRRHTVYWQQAPILTHTLRYEDLKDQPIPNVRPCRRPPRPSRPRA